MTFVKSRFRAMLHPPRPFFQRKKKDLSVPRTNVKMMVMLREKRVSFPITFVAKIGFANRPTTIISIALAAQKWWLHHHHHHLLKYYRENEWPSFIFFLCSFTKENVPRKRSVFSSSVYLFVNIAGMWYDGSAQLISFVSWNCRSNQQVENKPYHVPHVLMQL